MHPSTRARPIPARLSSRGFRGESGSCPAHARREDRADREPKPRTGAQGRVSLAAAPRPARRCARSGSTRTATAGTEEPEARIRGARQVAPHHQLEHSGDREDGDQWFEPVLTRDVLDPVHVLNVQQALDAALVRAGRARSAAGRSPIPTSRRRADGVALIASRPCTPPPPKERSWKPQPTPSPPRPRNRKQCGQAGAICRRACPAPAGAPRHHRGLGRSRRADGSARVGRGTAYRRSNERPGYS